MSATGRAIRREALRVLQDECGLAPDHVIADIASGTGIWTRMLLENGNPVFGVEPNAEMRQAGERLLAEFPNFTSVAGTAEATTLPDASVDFVTAAQAAHWFDRERARRRSSFAFSKPGGWLVLLWNERLTDSTPFSARLRATAADLTAPTTQDVRHERTTDAVNEFFDPAAISRATCSPCGRSSTMPGSKAGCCPRPTRRDRSIRITRRCCATCGASSMHTPHCRARHLRLQNARVFWTIEVRDRENKLPDEKSFHMTPEEFRRHGHAVVDWIADYQARIESFPVLSQVKPGEIRASLPAQSSGAGRAVRRAAERCRAHSSCPASPTGSRRISFAYFPCNASGPGILGDLLSSGLGVQGMLWSTSPACTELETHVMDWLVAMLGLPEKFLSSNTGGGVIQDTASSAALCALLAARERATNYVSNKKGCDGRLVAYASTQTHSSLEKAAMIAGIGVDNLRLIEVDENLAMRPDALARQIEADRRIGPDSILCLCDGRHHFFQRDGPRRRNRRSLPPAQSLAARRCCHVRHRHALP